MQGSFFLALPGVSSIESLVCALGSKLIMEKVPVLRHTPTLLLPRHTASMNQKLVVANRG